MNVVTQEKFGPKLLSIIMEINRIIKHVPTYLPPYKGEKVYIRLALNLFLG